VPASDTQRVGSPTVDNVGPLWPALLEFAEAPEHREPFEEAGLIVGPLDVTHLYQATPINTVTFASTGVNGVHFGFLAEPDTALDNCPVVMTVPLAAEPNHVVGATLHEFLSLGCRQGWAFLEQLAHDPEWTTQWYQETESAVFRLADPFSRRLGLTPWPDVTRRLGELAREYHHRLVVRAAQAPEPSDEPQDEPAERPVVAAQRTKTTVTTHPNTR
jgi:hypothetical protein